MPDIIEGLRPSDENEETTPETRHPQPVNAPVQKTIAAKLRKLFSNKAQTIAPAIPEEGGTGGSAPLVVTFSGTTDRDDAACDKTWDEVRSAGRNIHMYYQGPMGEIYELNAKFDGISVMGFFSVEDQPSVYCSFNEQDGVEVIYTR